MYRVDFFSETSPWVVKRMKKYIFKTMKKTFLVLSLLYAMSLIMGVGAIISDLPSHDTLQYERDTEILKSLSFVYFSNSGAAFAYPHVEVEGIERKYRDDLKERNVEILLMVIAGFYLWLIPMIPIYILGGSILWFMRKRQHRWMEETGCPACL